MGSLDIFESCCIEKSANTLKLNLKFRRPMPVSPDFHMHMEHLQGLTDLVNFFREKGIINTKENVSVSINKIITETQTDVTNLIMPVNEAVLTPFLLNSPSYRIEDVSTSMFCATLNPGLEFESCVQKLSRVLSEVDKLSVTRAEHHSPVIGPKL